MTKSIRSQDLAFYNNQPIDSRYQGLINLNSNSYVGVKTTGLGNCLYHAISMNLFGSEINSFKIKLLTVFMHFEYEDFFRKFLHRYCYFIATIIS